MLENVIPTKLKYETCNVVGLLQPLHIPEKP